MRERLIWKGYRPGSELYYLASPEAKHDENAWAACSPIPFQFLFGNLPRFLKSKRSKVGRVKSCAVIYRPDSKGAYESTLASCLEVMAVR